MFRHPNEIESPYRNGVQFETGRTAGIENRVHLSGEENILYTERPGIHRLHIIGCANLNCGVVKGADNRSIPTGAFQREVRLAHARGQGMSHASEACALTFVKNM